MAIIAILDNYLILSSHLAHGASFNCVDASKVLHKVICGRQELFSLNVKMQRLYGQKSAETDVDNGVLA
jgi:uncharacterized protein